MRLVNVFNRWRGRKQPKPSSPQAMRKMLGMIERTRDDEYSCDQVHELMDQFAEAVLRGQDAAKLMPLVQHHLDMCPDCREEFEALMRILQAAPV
jgi:hypothetical protein